MTDIPGDLLVITPSRGRPQNIARLLDAVHATSQVKAHVHVAVDDDDAELERYEYVMKTAGKDGDKLITGSRKGLTDWTNVISLENVDRYPFFASFGDDHVPVTPGWDRLLITGILRMGGIGFTYPWDGVREDIPEAVVLSSPIVKALGWMAYPGSSHWYIDNIWADLGKGAGCIRHLRAIKVEHQWKGDKTSRESGEKFTADREAYYLWRKTQMNDDIKKIVLLRESTTQPITTVGSEELQPAG